MDARYRLVQWRARGRGPEPLCASNWQSGHRAGTIGAALTGPVRPAAAKRMDGRFEALRPDLPTPANRSPAFRMGVSYAWETIRVPDRAVHAPGRGLRADPSARQA